MNNFVKDRLPPSIVISPILTQLRWLQGTYGHRLIAPCSIYGRWADVLSSLSNTVFLSPRSTSILNSNRSIKVGPLSSSTFHIDGKATDSVNRWSHPGKMLDAGLTQYTARVGAHVSRASQNTDWSYEVLCFFLYAEFNCLD